MNFQLVHPSRSRPKKSFETISKWIRRADNPGNIFVIVSLDQDDPTEYEYEKIYRTDTGFHWWMFSSNNRSAVGAVNNAAKENVGDVLIVVSDDTDCPQHWDKILIDAIGDSKDFVMKTWDGIQKRIITMPIMDRTYYNRDKHIYHPDFRHSWCDTYLTDLAHHRGRVITRLDIHFPHDHYSVLKQEPDELYKRNDKTHDEDRHIYIEKKKMLAYA